MDKVPDRSEIQIENIEVHKDPVLKSMIKDLGLRHLVPGMNKKDGQVKRNPRKQE
jgi:hypothetical protein